MAFRSAREMYFTEELHGCSAESHKMLQLSLFRFSALLLCVSSQFGCQFFRLQNGNFQYLSLAIIVRILHFV